MPRYPGVDFAHLPNRFHRFEKIDLPDPDFQDATEVLGDGGDEFPDVEDELLLQHGLSRVVREALAVQDVLDLVRRQRFIDHLLLLAEHPNRHLGTRTSRVKLGCSRSSTVHTKSGAKGLIGSPEHAAACCQSDCTWSVKRVFS